ncbi:MAG TPA: ATP synthase F1 subunit delta [Blastocatellia bacterium]|nr:ATP synthase F1 subunit delta [Blastocatellia bacterium]
MSVSTIANRYARALADVLVERRETNEVVKELIGFERMMDDHSQLRDVFASPVIATDRKRAVLKELLARIRPRQTTANYLQLLLSNSRLHDLDQMLRALSRELDARMNIVSAEITTAREISEQEKVALQRQLKATTGQEVRMQFRTDPAIIGGMITRIGSLVYDGSIRNQLAQMKRRLMNP